MILLFVSIAFAAAPKTKTLADCAGETAAKINNVGKAVREAGKSARCPTSAPPRVEAPPALDLKAELAGVKDDVVEVTDTFGCKNTFNVVPEELLPAIFESATQTQPYANPSDSCICAERTHSWGWNLDRMYGLKTGKLITTPDAAGYISPKGTALDRTWRFHVGMLVMVRVKGKPEPQEYVIDSGLFPRGPVTRQEWEDKQNHVGKVSLTNQYALNDKDLSFLSRRLRGCYKSYPESQADLRNITTNNVQLTVGKGRFACGAAG